ncbi:tight adherence protein B [Salinibacterium amurskyense]|uniref:Tight adherence protein B n=1 Tax=Salinibacterium amurskyense TaxID=205941 RepID=A0A2M9D3R0_9MICO|nr:type II secretion system F family protein [Salinibacterium amurskyense]PJJ78834.1 tight adherence protein B [Salinibacterium amurskyense]RLQ80896.1 type II secretion system protein F [Salinibacterium amurskyense]GHD83586.1 type II secretion system protein F [Salinibacterium amurskyense]
MSLILGIILAVGVTLISAPFLWPMQSERHVRGRSAWSLRLRERLVQAGLPTTSPSIVVIVSLVFSIAVAAITFVLTSVIAVVICAAAAALVLPALAISWRARARRKATQVVWPDVVDQLVSAVRSGLALPDSLMTVAHTGPLVTRSAFAAFAARYRATGNFAIAVDELKVALADPVADRILETLRMSREVGGSELTNVLRSLSVYLRQEAAIRSEIEARQGWVMNAARLGLAAPWVVLFLLTTRPEAALAYNSAGGVALIVAGLVLSVIAYRIMAGIGRLPEQPRWFA